MVKYLNNSKYVTVEIAADETIQNSVPCGFMGYPLRKYSGLLKQFQWVIIKLGILILGERKTVFWIF